MKKIIAISLCLCMIFGCLTGCKNSSGTGKSDVAVINVWTPDSHSKAVMDELVTNYNNTTGKKDGIKIVYTVKEGDLGQIVDMAIASNQAPEMYVTYKLDQYAESGDIAAIEDMPGGTEYLKKYDPALLKKYQVKGKTYKVPYYVTTFGLAYNKEMFKKYGIVDENGEAKAPETYDELRKDAEILTHPEKKEYGIILPLKWGSFFDVDVASPAMRSAGISGYDFTTGKFDYSSLNGIINMYMGIKNDKSYFPGAEGIDNDPARAQFAEGKIGMKFAASFDVGVYNEQFPTSMDWGVAPYPVENVNNIYKQRMSSDGFLCINKKALEKVGPEKMMKAFEWLHSEEVLKKLYQEGLAIPYDWNMVKNIKLENPKKGWVDFCKLTEISTSHISVPSPDLAGGKDSKTVFMDDIWTAGKDTKSVLTDLTNRYNKGLEKRIKDDPTFEQSKYIDKTWSTKITK